MNAVQLNTRVSADLRERGSKSFKNAGVTLSEAIRIYLDFASRNLKNPVKVVEVLDSMKADENEAEKRRKLKAIKEGAMFFENFCKENGIKTKQGSVLSKMSYKELRDLAYDDLYDEKYAR